MKILLTGASGFLGKALLKVLTRSHTVIGMAHTQRNPDLLNFDITDFAAVDATMKSVQPEFIIHSAANRDPDLCEKDRSRARQINVSGTEHLVRSAKNIGARILYISTDLVFDGESPPYREKERPEPISYYGTTKLQGEDLVREIPRSTVLRIPLLYGFHSREEKTMITSTIELIRQSGETRVDDLTIKYPTLIDDVAEAVAFLIDTNAEGIFHYSGCFGRTRFELTREIGRIFDLSTEHLQPEPNPDYFASRPRDSHLDTDKIEKLGFSQFTDFREKVKEIRSLLL